MRKQTIKTNEKNTQQRQPVLYGCSNTRGLRPDLSPVDLEVQVPADELARDAAKPRHAADEIHIRMNAATSLTPPRPTNHTRIDLERKRSRVRLLTGALSSGTLRVL